MSADSSDVSSAAILSTDQEADGLFDDAEVEQAQESQRLRMLVSFRTVADRHAFSLLLNQRVSKRTDVLHYSPTAKPAAEISSVVDPLTVPAVEQTGLFEVEKDWLEAWQGMPAYAQQDLTPEHMITVYFDSQADRRTFADLIGASITDDTLSVWYPKNEIDKVIGLRWRSTAPQNPQYPVYVPTKGRWDSAYTIKCLERLGVPYFAVVQPQEREHYAPVVKSGTLLLLPEGLDGLVPTRNWIFEHSVLAGAERHWQLDDNIKSFFRYHENRQIHVADGTCMRIAEDFADRYENIAIAGFQYYMFVPRKKADFPPYVFNTRVYSNSLINNRMPYRYRDVYNDDTDICLRAMKDGWCTVQFNAFLAWKQPTMVVKGGNTPIYLGAEAIAAEWVAHAASCKKCTVDESPTDCDAGLAILSRDGRWKMAASLKRQHPDVTTIGRRFGRWQHYVDYRRFKKNALVFRPSFVMPVGQNEYGLELVEIEPAPNRGQARAEEPDEPTAPHLPASAPAISALDFAAMPSAQPEQPVHQFALARPEEPKPVPIAAVQEAPAGPSRAQLLKAAFEAKGHRLMTRDGRLFVSNASKLSDEERAAAKAIKAELIAIADVAVAEGPVEQTGLYMQTQSPAALEFAGATTAKRDAEWKADEPPDLTGIDAIVLNFATNGLRWDKGDRPIGVTVGTLDGKMTRFLPFGFTYGGNLDEAVVKRWFREQVRGKKIVNSKTKFDVHHAREWGIDLEEQGCTFSDVQHTAALLDDHRKRFAIDVLADEYLPDLPKVARVDERAHGNNHASDVAERELFTVQLVGKLTAVLQPQIDAQELRVVHDLEDAVIAPVVEMEKNGARIDVELLARYEQECATKHDELMWDIAREVGFGFTHDPNGWTRLLEKLGLPVPDAFDEETLTEIQHPLVRKGQKAAQYASLNSKTFKAYKEQIDDGILRYEINQLRGDDGGTVSGRFSIGYVQQVPNHDNHATVFGEDLFPRRLFVAAPGFEYFAADAMQIEYRLFAHYANNPDVLKAYRENPLLSFHKMTFSRMQAYKPDMLYAHQKSFNFARQYGAKSIKLAVMMKFITARVGEEIRRAKRWDDPRLNVIHEIEAAYAKMMPEGDVLLSRAAHLAKPACDEYCNLRDAWHRKGLEHRGCVKTLLGRRSRFPNNYKTYIGLNRVLQGTGADIMKTKLVELHKARKQTGFLLRMTVHDELTGDKGDAQTPEKVMEILNRQSYPQLRVPILWEGKAGATWADCK